MKSIIYRRQFINTTTIIIVVAVMVIAGIILDLVFSRRRSSDQLQEKFGAEYDRAVQTLGGEKKAQTELNERLKHVGTLEIRQLSVTEHDRYLAEWTAVQSKFVGEPMAQNKEAI